MLKRKKRVKILLLTLVVVFIITIPAFSLTTTRNFITTQTETNSIQGCCKKYQVDFNDAKNVTVLNHVRLPNEQHYIFIHNLLRVYTLTMQSFILNKLIQLQLSVDKLNTTILKYLDKCNNVIRLRESPQA